MTINCNGQLISFQRPKIMGILNLTPDSFFDGGKYQDEKAILTQTQKMLAEGATFIDVGGYSSRPGAATVSEEEEFLRMVPIVTLLKKEFPEIILSIDTFRSTVAQACLVEGAALINDISAGQLDPNMMATVAEHNVPYLMMHMKGNPQNMQQQTQYKDLLTDILFYFSQRIAEARKLGIHDLIIDVGFGFSKTTAHNFQLLQKLELLTNLELPMLVGVSRKSMIYKTLQSNAADALNGTTALHMIALCNGANILRVHDVKEAMECITLFEHTFNLTD